MNDANSSSELDMATELSEKNENELKFSPQEKWLNLSKDQLANQAQVLVGLSVGLITEDPGTQESTRQAVR